MGYCYLIHLDTPLSENHTARHYLGYCRHVPSRMEAHRTGRGARFMQVVRERGIAWSIARIWPGDRTYERKLKNQKNAARLCPLCKRMPPNGQLTLDLDPLDDLI
jgi:predicted GIY-YIG superfamily endonuclease